MDIREIESLEEFGKLTDNAKTTEVQLNLIKVKGKEEKVFDLRRWEIKASGVYERSLDGITLTAGELEELKCVLDAVTIPNT